MERLSGVVLLLVTLALGGCGERNVSSSDGGPVPDGTGDQLVAFDALQPPDQLVPRDGQPQPDAGPRDAPSGCTAAAPLTLTGGKAQVSGTIQPTDSDNDVVLQASSCATATTVGVDRFYTVSLVSGKAYTIALETTAGLEAAVYVFASCSDVAGTCVGGATTDPTSKPAQVMVIAGNIGTYTIGVDSTAAPGASGGHGDYTLTVTEMANTDTCIGAASLTWSSGKASTTGDTSTATDTVNLSFSGSTSSPTPGPDRFYAVELTAGQAYKVTVTPTGSFVPAVYVLQSCTNPATSCVAGADSGSPGGSAVTTLTPKTTGTYFIGVDYSAPPFIPESSGPFTLTVEKFVPAQNDSCASAEALTWSSGKASATGDTSLAVDDVNLSTPYPGNCMFKGTPGPDLFYSVAVTGGKAYKVTVTPTTPWPAAVYVFESCTNPAGTCLAGLEYPPPTGAAVTFTAPKTGNLLIGVDSAAMPGGGGPFTVTVEEFVPPQNDTCASAQTLTWNAGKATASGDTTMATNAVDLMGTSGACAVKGTPGKDLFYALPVTAGKAYKVTASAGSSGPMPPWPIALYVLGGCTNPSGTC
ncbi:MAG: hypothetical protein JRI55_39795, partial [Deltaproteobacteria bacterium]|nr:hypothetical protein [Deltaproteobacteria bacterium]